MKVTTPERFFAKCDRSGGHESCWVWQGAVTRRYGAAAFQGKSVRAHRLAWLFTNGPIPPGNFVCHSCDVPLCCNPRHLWVGTPQDNSFDCVSKGRQRKREDHPSCKLTEGQVQQIRDLMKTPLHRAIIAAHFGVSEPLLRKIVQGAVWADDATRKRRAKEKKNA